MKDPIGKIISSIYRHQHILISRALISGKCRIGPGQIYVFLVIGVTEGLYQKDIMKALKLEKATVAKAVKKLREDGYVRIEEDPDDNLVLACAVEAGTDCIVSGDSHLLQLRRYRGIEILTPAELLDRLG